MRRTYILKYLLIIVALSPCSIFAQIPNGYYAGAENKTGSELKLALYNIIKGHTEFPYTHSETDTWDIVKEADRDTTNNQNVLLVYVGTSVDAEQEYNNGKGWSREHVWAKSRGDFGTSTGTGTDVHNLKACDISANSKRNNRWFGNATTAYYTGTTDTGCKYSDTNWTWKPRDDMKGDMARIMFYMGTRYQGENGEPNLALINYYPIDKYTKNPIHAKLSHLYAWHLADPVNNFERNRNEVVYRYQKNRNPFVDHPEYVEMIWKSIVSVKQTVSKSTIIFPNPAFSQLVTIRFASSAIRTIQVVSVTGKQVLQKDILDQQTTLDLPKGVYIVNISTGNNTENHKLVISQ